MHVSKNLAIMLKLIATQGNVTPLLKRGVSFYGISLLIDEAESKGLAFRQVIMGHPISYGSTNKVTVRLTKRGEIAQHYFKKSKLPKIV